LCLRGQNLLPQKALFNFLTLVVLVFYFRRDWAELIRHLVLLACVSAVSAGFALHELKEKALLWS